MLQSTTFVATILIICAIAYLVLIVAIWRWRLNRLHERAPSSEKLLRGPGESLRKKLDSLDETILSHLVACLFFPPLLGLIALGINPLLPDQFRPWTLPAAVALSLLMLTVFALKLLHTLSVRRNCYLGYFGERIVSEQLTPLLAEGCRIFHDVPATVGTRAFNIDHVIIAPAGIFAIETKTRRKAQTNTPGIDANKVTFDGNKLAYPWGRDKHGLEQAHSNALWLEKFLTQLIGKHTLPVFPILTLPGWWIEETDAAKTSTVRVLNPKQIAPLVRSTTPTLSPDQADLIARQLEALCRDVEF